MTRTSLGLLLVASLSMGCDEDSANVPTSDIRLDVEATAGDRVAVILYERETTGRIALTGGDRLVAATDTVDEIVLKESPVATLYEADLANDLQSLSVELIREAHDSAKLSTPLSPEPAFDSPTSFSRADDAITITWSNPDPEARVVVFVDSCADIQIESPESKQSVDDEGSFTLPMSEVLAEAGGTSSDCASIQVIRIRDAEVDPALFAQTTMWARRVTNFEVTLTP